MIIFNKCVGTGSKQYMLIHQILLGSTLVNFLQRGNTQGGFGISAVLPTSGSEPFIKNYSFLFHGC